jgi:hypothetical protein
MKTFLAWAMAAACVSGCAAPMHSTSGYFEHHPYAHERQGHATLADLAEAIDIAAASNDSLAASAATDDTELPPGTYGAYRPYVPPPPPRVTAPDPVHVAFDQTKAHVALEAIDLSACKTLGAPAGYGRARVTFGAEGKTKQVAIQAPDGLSKEAVECLGEHIGAAEVPPFDGASIEMETSYRVQ